MPYFVFAVEFSKKVGFGMSFTWKKSVVIWVIGFLTFVAALSTIDAAVIWAVNGIDSMVPVYIIGDLIPVWKNVSVTGYFWVSLTATFLLLGLATFQGFRRPPLGLEVHRMTSKVEDEMVATRGALESTRISLFAKIEDEKIARQDMIATLNESVGSVRKEMLVELERHNAALDNELKELKDVIKELGRLRQDVLDHDAQHNKNVLASENSSRKEAPNSQTGANGLAE